MTLHPADRLAFDRALVTQPVWNRFDTAKAALSLPENVLLVTISGPLLRIPPPLLAELPENVVLVTVSVPLLSMPPPP